MTVAIKEETVVEYFWRLPYSRRKARLMSAFRRVREHRVTNEDYAIFASCILKYMATEFMETHRKGFRV